MARFEQTVHFLGSERLCPTTATFSFTRPEGYTFRAGEFFTLTIPTREGQQSHTFSHADVPGDDAIMILTRLTGSAFKDALVAMTPGAEVRVAGPAGALALGPEVQRAAFLVGGVGVSPARSIVRDVALTGRDVDICLFDGNPDESCIPFRAEFARYAAERDTIRVVHVLASPPAEWDGESGFITAELVRRHCDPFDDRHWYVCGPPLMVEAMRRVIDELGVPADHRHFELFAGYR